MNNLNGILLLVGSMAAFAIEDMFIKHLSVSVPTGQILVVLGVVCGVAFALLTVASRKRIFEPAAWKAVPLIRASTEGVAAVAFVTALSSIDLSTVAAVFQALPLVITMGAALFLGETVGWRRWSAIGVGFIGVLMIIRPGLEGFQPETLLVILSVVLIAARDLITRRLDTRVPSTVVAMQAYLSATLAGAVLMVWADQPVAPLQSAHVFPYLAAFLSSMLGYYGIVAAMRVGEASAMMPFRYTRLVFSMIAGMLMFYERPDALTLAGASLIIASGLYTFVRERRLARQLAIA
ncbi:MULTISPECIES: DMT family transporter [unclassified Ruegeria]|uniref:DMT family transporter n=1 Tax=unclassified Ruegeria TaxID=2625375 RepID=UPI0014876EAE|nr:MULTISPECIES: DMT family transporter [unclassified Ruegeria]